MRQTAKRLLFLVFLFLYYSIMFDYASAQTESSNPLSACFQTHALNQQIPVQVHFQLYAGSMFSTEILDTTLIYIKQKRQYQLSATAENMLPEHLFQELFIAINTTPWSPEPVPKTFHDLLNKDLIRQGLGSLAASHHSLKPTALKLGKLS